MKLLNDLFTTDYGLMSIIGIGIMVVASVAFVSILKSKIEADPKDTDKSR
ncbi:MAG: DUF3149 domain-containing protein [Giesbergeria sp.]|nr:DUF3149 domain-containing protein [Giesbergeria sp.]MDD2609948.1 DUF3149 domain-containing protein [Giesbergeria sp.]